MGKFKILDHTADLKIKIYGRNLKELFANAGLSIAEQQKPGGFHSEEIDEWELIEIQSPDLNSLLADWLNEILSRSDLNNKVYRNFKIEELSENYLRAKIAGQKVNQKQIEVKAATYYGLDIKKKNGRWEAIVIFDI